jgi:hypothetical protein
MQWFIYSIAFVVVCLANIIANPHINRQGWLQDYLQLMPYWMVGAVIVHFLNKWW